MSWLRRRRPPVLRAADAYRRWAADYGRVPNALQELEQEALLQLLPELDGRSVLDVGCGPGRLARLALERRAERTVGIDASLAMLGRARREAPGAAWVAASLGALPLHRPAFDLVLCTLVLGHVRRLEPALAALSSALRPGGTLLLSDFHPYATLRGFDRTFSDPREGRTYAVEQHLHLFEDYVEGLRSAGLRIEALREPRWRGSPVAFVLRAGKGE